MSALPVYPIHVQLRVTAAHKGFGVGEVIASTPGLVTLQNRNEETATVATDLVKSVSTTLATCVVESVNGITSQLAYMTAMAQLPFVRTFADLHDHMDANVLLINHVPEMFPRDADGDTDERQHDLEQRVCELVNQWLIQRWDNDPSNQPAPDTDEKVASILHAMLGMSLDEQQWGNANAVEVMDGFGDDQVRLRIADHTFTIRVTREA